MATERSRFFGGAERSAGQIVDGKMVPPMLAQKSQKGAAPTEET